MGLEKLKIRNLDTQERLICLFNPTEYQIAKENTWTPKPVVGKNVPQMDFTGGGARKLTMDLFFDVYESGGDVRTHLQQLEKLTLINERKINPQTKRARPPFCLVEWGQHWGFKAVLSSLTIKYTLFREDGTPVRATASVVFQEAEDENDLSSTSIAGLAELGRNSALVQPSDTLALMSYREYGDPSHWRAIAQENGLDDPMKLISGQVLAIPALKDIMKS